jgi:hypothetical protein
MQTRQAMAAFIEWANAKLPTDKADPVLLALVKHHAGIARGSCPTGQESSPEGRCLPKATVTRAVSLQPIPPLRPAIETPLVADANLPHRSRRAHRGSRMEGRMGVRAAIATPRPLDAAPKIAATEQLRPGPPPAAQSRREKRAARDANRHVASLTSASYHRAMRAPRYAYRPFGRPRGIAALLFGWF